MFSPGPEGSLKEPIEEYSLQAEQSIPRQSIQLQPCPRRQRYRAESEGFQVRTESGKRNAGLDLSWISPTRPGRTRPRSDRLARGSLQGREGTPTRARPTKQEQQLYPTHRAPQPAHALQRCLEIQLPSWSCQHPQ